MTEQLLAVIVENNQFLRTELKNLLETQCQTKVKVIGETENEKQALEMFQQIKRFDIAFLNIQLGVTKAERSAGIDLAHWLNQRCNPPYVIFTSDNRDEYLAALGRYILPALREHPAAFLKKPIALCDLETAINYVLSKKQK